jgi:hypothetical protein
MRHDFPIWTNQKKTLAIAEETKFTPLKITAKIAAAGAKQINAATTAINKKNTEPAVEFIQDFINYPF